MDKVEANASRISITENADVLALVEDAVYLALRRGAQMVDVFDRCNAAFRAYESFHRVYLTLVRAREEAEGK